MKTIRLIALSFLFLLHLFCTSQYSKEKQEGGISLPSTARFKAGDSLGWKDTGYNDRLWSTIDLSKPWEKQGYTNYDGYAWYRIRFKLPANIEKEALFKDSLQIFLGKIDDYDQVFLNGQFLGQNGRTFPDYSKAPGEFTAGYTVYYLPRRYVISVNDSRLHWNGQNTMAVRVFDSGGLGGMYDRSKRRVFIMDWDSYLKIKTRDDPFQLLEDNHFRKTLIVDNTNSQKTIEGRLQIKVVSEKTGQMIFDKNVSLSLKGRQNKQVDFEFSDSLHIPHQVVYSFTEKRSGRSIEKQESVPYVLTPPASDQPRINGPTIYGARPGHSFLYRIPVSGKRPVRFLARNLPPGLHLDANKGMISGSVQKPGKYRVRLAVKNTLGSDSSDFKIVIGEEIELTPALGWNSWNCWGTSVDDQKIRQAADYMVSSGLANHGWTYINIDDGWEAGRDAQGHILSNHKFPDMKALADYLHGKGLKLGVYSSPGPQTCAGYTGSYQHELPDAKVYAAWGVDYLKYDLCTYRDLMKDTRSPAELMPPYQIMNDALHRINRDIIYSLCEYGNGRVWEWGKRVGGNSWRTTGDITDTWESMSVIGFSQDTLYKYAQPGHWNDPDMLVVGQVGWGPSLHPSRLNPDEQYTHISLWALLSAPLLIGCDLGQLDTFTLNLLSNDEVLAVDQDELGRQARPVFRSNGIEIWAKELANGDWAVGLFNRGMKMQQARLEWPYLGISGPYIVRDLWRQKNRGIFGHTFTTSVRPHGVVLLQMQKKL